MSNERLLLKMRKMLILPIIANDYLYTNDYVDIKSQNKENKKLKPTNHQYSGVAHHFVLFGSKTS